MASPHSTLQPYRLKTAAELAGLPYWETDSNPLKVLRTTSNLTQEDLALASRVSVQMITRQEMGMVNQPSSKTIRALSEATDISEDKILAEYHRWVFNRREALKWALAGAGLGKMLGYDRKTGGHKDNQQVIYDLCSFVGVPATVYSFCRILAVHVWTVQSWVNRNVLQGTMRGVLEEGGVL